MVLITGTVILVAIAAVVGILILGGGLASFSLSSIPAWFWVLLGIVVLFKIMAGKKK